MSVVVSLKRVIWKRISATRVPLTSKPMALASLMQLSHDLSETHVVSAVK